VVSLSVLWRTMAKDKDKEGETVKLKMGCDFVRDGNWQPREFKSDAGIVRYVLRAMPEYLKRLGFGVALWHGPEYVQASYGRKC